MDLRLDGERINSTNVGTTNRSIQSHAPCRITSLIRLRNTAERHPGRGVGTSHPDCRLELRSWVICIVFQFLLSWILLV